MGGYKDSGIGHEHSIGELMSYTRIKNINVAYWTRPPALHSIRCLQLRGLS